MLITGAGGTRGGIGRFFLGLAMMVAGGYLFLDAIQVTQGFHMGYALYRFGTFQLTTGMVLVPLIFGIGLIFYNAKNPLGWLLAAASLIMILFGIISSIRLRLRPMSAFELIMILILFIGGVGLFFNSLKAFEET